MCDLKLQKYGKIGLDSLGALSLTKETDRHGELINKEDCYELISRGMKAQGHVWQRKEEILSTWEDLGRLPEGGRSWTNS